MNKSHLLINEPALQVLPSLAVAIGLNEAIVLQQVQYWINNPKNKGYEEGGFKWVYNTYAEWKETNFPFWSEATIQRIFSNLEGAGLIVSIQPMKGKYDRTKYYRIEYSKLDMFDDSKLLCSDDSKLLCSLNESETTAETTHKPDLIDFEIQRAKENQAIQDALNDFEKTFGFGALNWDSRPEWRRFSKWVVTEYQRDNSVFSDYVQWRNGAGKYQAMSNNKIRQNPEMFMDTGYPTFLAHASMYPETTSKEFGL